MTLPPPAQKAWDRLDRTIEDALPDLAWLSRLDVGGQIKTQMADLYGRINALRAAMAQDARTDEEQP